MCSEGSQLGLFDGRTDCYTLECWDYLILFQAYLSLKYSGVSIKLELFKILG